VPSRGPALHHGSARLGCSNAFSSGEYRVLCESASVFREPRPTKLGRAPLLLTSYIELRARSRNPNPVSRVFSATDAAISTGDFCARHALISFLYAQRLVPIRFVTGRDGHTGAE
jgi:hypothetical protein